MSNDFSMNMFGDYSNKKMDSSLKLPICLVLDKSGSMMEKTKSTKGQNVVKIAELNQNVQRFLDFVKQDPKASRICDIAIIAFGGYNPEVVSGYSKIENVTFNPLQASGATPLGGAIDMAIDLLEKRRTFYKDQSIEHYKPIMMIMSDGDPTDEYKKAAKRCSDLIRSKRLKLYPVGIGQNFNAEILTEFSPDLPPKRIDDMQGFTKLFELLSRSSSNPHDDSIDKWFNESL